MVTHPAADLDKGREEAAAGAAAPAKAGPDPSRAFSKDGNSRTSSAGLCVFLSHTHTLSLSHHGIRYPFKQAHPSYTHTHTHIQHVRRRQSWWIMSFTHTQRVRRLGEFVDHVAHINTHT